MGFTSNVSLLILEKVQRLLTRFKSSRVPPRQTQVLESALATAVFFSSPVEHVEWKKHRKATVDVWSNRCSAFGFGPVTGKGELHAMERGRERDVGRDGVNVLLKTPLRRKQRKKCSYCKTKGKTREKPNDKWILLELLFWWWHSYLTRPHAFEELRVVDFDAGDSRELLHGWEFWVVGLIHVGLWGVWWSVAVKE
jgi:hypothetical protein